MSKPSKAEKAKAIQSVRKGARHRKILLDLEVEIRDFSARALKLIGEAKAERKQRNY